MEIIWVSSELGIVESKRTESKLKNLKSISRTLDFQVRSFSGVKGQNPLPWRRERPGFLERDCDEIGIEDMGLDLFEYLFEIRPCYLLDSPFLASISPVDNAIHLA